MGQAVLGREDLNHMKWQIYRQLPPLKQRVSGLYYELQKNDMSWEDNTWIELKNIVSVLANSNLLFESPEIRERCEQISSTIEKRESETVQRILLLGNIFGVLEELESYIRQKIKRCNACGNDVFFMPIPADYELRRKENGFLYWKADFQLESKENYTCPVCGACDRERLMIAFLEEVRAENGEILKMLQIAPSPVMERYALGREDIRYESMELSMPEGAFQGNLQHMEMVADGTYDIIVCSHVLEHVRNDVQAMRELHRILKPNGVCLVLVPLIVGKAETEEQWGCGKEENWRRFGQGDHSRLYGKNDFIRRLEGTGFHVNELGREWFGEEFYQAHGFDDLSVMYVATKEMVLAERDEKDPISRELIGLQEENRLLRQALNDINDRLMGLQKSSSTNFTILFHSMENIGWEISDRRFQEKLWYPKIMSKEDTIQEIVENRKSIARFGDGEFGIMNGVQRWRFQKRDEKLACRLKEVLHAKNNHILVGLSDIYGDMSTWESSAANGARIYLTPEVRKQNYALLDRDRIYANTGISRSENRDEVRNQKRIWEGRDCVFIEGFQTRMGVGNDLFDNAKAIARILCPAESAFDRYEDIYNEALKQPKDKLILIALGPTASVLAYDLALRGYQAVDIGHADLSYEWLLQGSYGRVPNKYSNEAPDGYIVEEIHDAEYEAQIIADLH